MTPIVFSSSPDTVAFTAHVKMAPTAIRIKLTPIPISSNLLGSVVSRLVAL
jgi:hypothetical protein